VNVVRTGLFVQCRVIRDQH